MLAFAQASRGECLTTDCETGGVNLTAYAVQNGDRRLAVAVINKDMNTDTDITITADRGLHHATALRLTGRALDRADGVTLGGASVASDGRWQPKEVEALRVAAGTCEVHVPAASAAIVRWGA